MSLVAARDHASEHARIRDEELVEARGSRDGVEAELRRVRREGERLATKIEDLKERLAELEAGRGGLEAEVTRLNAVLEMIYASRTWRLKELVNSLLGRSQKR
jgi:chromosome segregation ATPase